MASIREVKEGTQLQGEDEFVSYSFLSTPWGSSPGTPTVKVFDQDGNDVTSTVMPGSPAAPVGDLISLPLLGSLTVDNIYRVEVLFVAEGNTWEAIIPVACEK